MLVSSCSDPRSAATSEHNAAEADADGAAALDEGLPADAGLPDALPPEPHAAASSTRPERRMPRQECRGQRDSAHTVRACLRAASFASYTAGENSAAPRRHPSEGILPVHGPGYGDLPVRPSGRWPLPDTGGEPADAAGYPESSRDQQAEIDRLRGGSGKPHVVAAQDVQESGSSGGRLDEPDGAPGSGRSASRCQTAASGSAGASVTPLVTASCQRDLAAQWQRVPAQPGGSGSA